MQDLTQLLSDAGIDMTGNTLVAALAISPDGMWISAVTTRPDPTFPLFVTEVAVLASLDAPAGPQSRLLNLSTRGLAQSGDEALIAGFVLSGSADKKLLIRAVGPTLGDFGVAGALPDPLLTLKRRVGEADINYASNDNRGTNTNLADILATTATVGAFDLTSGNTDAVLLVDLPPGQYTAVAGGVGGATGVAIVELYDAAPTDAGPAASRLINISNRGFAGAGDQVMIPGFAISSEGPKSLLVRVVGPTLGGFGVAGTMLDPRLTVYRGEPDDGSTEILSQDNWSDNPESENTALVAAQVGAFPLGEGSADAAFVITLAPGWYTVVGSSSVPGGTGVVLVEVYVVD